MFWALDQLSPCNKLWKLSVNKKVKNVPWCVSFFYFLIIALMFNKGPLDCYKSLYKDSASVCLKFFSSYQDPIIQRSILY